MVAMVLTQLKLRWEEPISTNLQGWEEKSGRVETLWGQGGALFLIGGGGPRRPFQEGEHGVGIVTQVRRSACGYLWEEHSRPREPQVQRPGGRSFRKTPREEPGGLTARAKWEGDEGRRRITEAAGHSSSMARVMVLVLRFRLVDRRV